MKHQITEFAVDYLGAGGQKRGQEACTLTAHPAYDSNDVLAALRRT